MSMRVIQAKSMGTILVDEVVFIFYDNLYRDRGRYETKDF